MGLSRDEVRQFDRRAMEQWGVPGLVLMENAARNIACAVAAHMGGVRGKLVAVVAGRGNNGGDGFAVGRHLLRMGAEVTVFVIGDPQKTTDDAGVNLAILRKLGVTVRKLSSQEIPRLTDDLAGADVVIDALGGTGIRGGLRGDLAAAVEQINSAGRPVVAVDIPTGLDCDTGQAEGPAVRAELTVTMVARKQGFDAPGAGAYTGKVVVVDIGVPGPETT